MSSSAVTGTAHRCSGPPCRPWGPFRPRLRGRVGAEGEGVDGTEAGPRPRLTMRSGQRPAMQGARPAIHAERTCRSREVSDQGGGIREQGCIVSPPTRVRRPLLDRHLPENRRYGRFGDHAARYASHADQAGPRPGFIAPSPPMRMAAGGLAGRVAADLAGCFSEWSLRTPGLFRRRLASRCRRPGSGRGPGSPGSGWRRGCVSACCRSRRRWHAGRCGLSRR